MSDADQKRMADRLIEAWIEGRVELEELAALAAGEGPDAELLELLAAARHAAAPAISDREAEEALERVRSRVRAQRARWAVTPGVWLTAAAITVLAAGLAVWSSRRPAPGQATQMLGEKQEVPVKEVFFESVRDGKVVRFQMQVYGAIATKGKEVPHAPTPSL